MNAQNPTAGHVKASWLKQLNTDLGARGFRGDGGGTYSRRVGEDLDVLTLPLHAAGRGETAVDLANPRVGVKIARVTDLLSELRGGSDVTALTWDESLRDVASTSGATDLLERDAAWFTVADADDIGRGTQALLGLLDALAQPWWVSHKELPTLCRQMEAAYKGRRLNKIEMMAVVAYLAGKRDLVEQVLGDHEKELVRIGSAHPGLEENRSWAVAMTALLSGSRPD